MSQRAIAYVESLEPVLTEGEYAVMRTLAQLAREEDDAAQISMERLGQLADRTERWTRKLIRALERYGLILTEHQYFGVRWPRTTYRFVELEEQRPPARPDTVTVISVARALRRQAEAMRARIGQNGPQQERPRDPLLLAAIYEELQRAYRDETSIRAAEGGRSGA